MTKRSKVQPFERLSSACSGSGMEMGMATRLLSNESAKENGEMLGEQIGRSERIGGIT